MKQLRIATIILILSLASFFYIERLEVNTTGFVHISNFVYFFGVLSVIFTILIYRYIINVICLYTFIVLSTYISCKILLFNNYYFSNDIYLYSTITELLLIVLLICVVYRFVRALHEFEDAIDNLILPEGGGCVQPLDRATEKIQTQFILSRRHERPLSVVLIEPELESFRLTFSRLMREIQKTIVSRYATVRLARVIKSSLRRTDVLLHDRGRFIILCPETSDGASAVVADRIRAAVAEQFDVPVAYGTATFPNKALTFDELVKHAELHLQHSKELSRVSIYSSARMENHKPSLS